MIPTTIPHGRTARRLEWQYLPPAVRALIARRCGSPVVSAESQGAGFTPGFASVLTCADGSRHFVKAASVRAQRMFAESYREEARKLADLPAETPAPRLRWSLDDEDWVVLGIEHVTGRAPARPWRPAELDATLDALEECARVLTPAPGGAGAGTFEEEFAAFPAYWDALRAAPLGVPGLAEHADKAAALAAAYASVCGGRTLVHTDVRDDNVLLAPDGTALLCDWNWPVAGAAWIDSVLALIGPRGDGLDVEAVLSARPLTRDLPPEHVDVLLALVAGYFLHQSTQPVPHTSPYIRDAQRWQGDVVWNWLSERRAWS
ncbi:phosphotransferase [Nocardioides pantholopis]|uniref:phosphotransferase n=1 Tax=Nocardioides pantholopis TaxID=2483798 RepID=UPI001F496E78|nr:phosphotransferase [Nocardioides pantholopis]